MKVANLLDFCNQSGFNDLDYIPVITLTYVSSKTGKSDYHAVVQSQYFGYDEALVLTTIDSLAEDGETLVDCPILVENGRQKLQIGGKTDQWCLGSETCYVFYFN